ncbi:S9 family peptidase [Eilatimonas milleporae]|uniref:Acyl-peptide hydrolase n=1 Tax=Eilatimonas milleporae TaxID=911205 RepID=A0A3M0CS39_9PROT|nr:S9 family peptidase [Eilatimonas milleporae]RMB12342.1 dipeptidyl aminopeptidase/acylaminoacyl peptidase [Eilatimonas milleporae]
MRRMYAVLAAFMLAQGASGDDRDKADWPYAEDIPQTGPVSLGLAGEKPADITRFLLAQGAYGANLSPDGRSLAYISRVTGTPQIWLMTLGKAHESSPPRQLTFGNGVTFYRWHPDSGYLLYGADNNGDEREAFYLITADGLEERLVLPFSDGFRRFGDFSVDGDRFVYASTERNGRDFDIYAADLTTGTARMVYEGTYGFFPVAWQPGGTRILVSETRGEDGNNLHSLDVTTGEMIPVFVPEISAAYTQIEWRPDGAGFYMATNDGRDYQALAYMDMTAGETVLLDAGERDVDEVALAGGYLAWTTNDGGYSRLHVRHLASGRDVAVPELPAGVYRLDWAEGAAAPLLSISVSGPGLPGDIYLWSLKDDTVRHAVSSNLAGLRSADMVAPEAIRFSARDGVTVHGLLYLPEGVTAPAVVVDVHGGPTAQARPRWQPVTQYLVGKGIAVLDINVRGSTGFGKTYARLDNQEKRLDSVRDLADAVAWMKADGRVDADRAAVMGGSYGGYMVNAVMGAYPGVFRAGASFVGVSDWVRALQEASPGLKASDRIEYGDISEPRWQAFYAENSPINTVHKIAAPMFFEHGANDPRDPVSESDRMVKALRERGIEVTYLRFPDEGHSVRKLPNRIAFYRQLAAFLEKHLSDGGAVDGERAGR